MTNETSTLDARLAAASALAQKHGLPGAAELFFFYQCRDWMTDDEKIDRYEAYIEATRNAGGSQRWDARYEASAGRDNRTDREVARERMVARAAAMTDAEREEAAEMAAD